MTDQVETQEAPNGASATPEPGSKEYIEKMAAQYDAQFQAEGQAQQKTQGTPAVPPMPTNGVEKFYDKKTGAYNWEAHARELIYRSQQAKGKQQEKAPQNQEQPQNQAAAARDAVEAAGLNWGDVTARFEETGELSEDDYAKLEKVVPREIIDSYLEAMAIAQASIARQVVEYAGGQERLNSLMTWASKNLSQGEKDKYNTLLRSRDWSVALDALAAKKAASSPTRDEPNLLAGTGRGGVAGFASEAEMTKAIQDPRYKSDPAYRESVRAKIIASPFNPTGR